MGIILALIKSKSQPDQPPRRFGYLYNVALGGCVPCGTCRFFGNAYRTLRPGGVTDWQVGESAAAN